VVADPQRKPGGQGHIFRIIFTAPDGDTLGITAHAATTAGLIYDETEQLLIEDTQKIGTDYYYLVANEKGIATYLDIYTDLGGAESLAAAAEYVYVNSGLGYGDDKCGLLLALYLVPDGDSWTVDEEQPFTLYCNNLPDGLREEILTATEAYMSDWAWEDGLENDQRVVMGLAATLGNTVMHFGEEMPAAAPEAESQPAEEIKTEPAAPTATEAGYTEGSKCERCGIWEEGKESKPVAKLNGSLLRCAVLRETAELLGERVAILPQITAITITGELVNGFYPVTTAEGVGFIHNSYIEVA